MRSARQQREGTRIFGYPRAYIVIPTIQLILAVILICLGIYSTTVLIFTGSILTIFTVSVPGGASRVHISPPAAGENRV